MSFNEKNPLISYSGLPPFSEVKPEHVKEALDAIKDKPEEYQILILKSWNEWAEGGYLEPDEKYQYGYLKALKNALEVGDSTDE